MRTAPAVFLALLLVLSGCNGFLGNGTPTARPGSPGTSASPSSTAPGDVPDVPGVEDGRLTDVGTLLDAHREGLLETGFETDFRANGTTTFRGEVYESRRRQQTIVEPDRTEYVYRTTNFGQGVRFDHWGNGSVTVTRGQLGNTTRYQVGNATETRVLTGRPTLRNYVAATTLTVTDVREGDGRTLVTLEGSGLDDRSEETMRGIVPPNATDVRNYSVRVVVDAEGRILAFDASADYTIDGEPGFIELRYRVVRLDGPSVTRPDWVDEVLAER